MTDSGPTTLAPADAVDPARASPEFLELISRDFARQHLIISQGRPPHGRPPQGPAQGSPQQPDVSEWPVERFAVTSTTDPAAVHNVGVRLGVEPEAFDVGSETIARAIDEAYSAAHRHADPHDLAEGGLGAHMRSPDASEVDRLIVEADRDLLSTQGKGPIIKLVDALLFEALGRGASDIHVQAMPDRTLVRYRQDGVLHTAREVSRNLTQALTSRIKVMGRMDIAERRIPQDGRASVSIGTPAATANAERDHKRQVRGGHGRMVDLRISTMPTSHGERVVIRLLDNTQSLGEFSQLGMPADIAEPYLERANAASGMILLTGPTGSGKTTTLYATLRTIGSHEVNVMTIEDPIEYELALSGGTISQSQVNSKKGVTFATGLRHILRQDPDIIMVGEIRDGETARIAIQSSLTGHLVFSTLHTNDAASAITRLVDLGVEPYLVSASLSCVLAQRLVRLLHRECGGEGCVACFESGFRGRSGMFELLLMDANIRELVTAQAPLSSIRSAARSTDPPMRTLAEDGQRLVAAGLTNLLEVQRVVQGAA